MTLGDKKYRRERKKRGEGEGGGSMVMYCLSQEGSSRRAQRLILHYSTQIGYITGGKETSKGQNSSNSPHLP